jgi:hypothetical protein
MLMQTTMHEKLLILLKLIYLNTSTYIVTVKITLFEGCDLVRDSGRIVYKFLIIW